MKYDPMTGEPIQEETPVNETPENEIQMNETPVNEAPANGNLVNQVFDKVKTFVSNAATKQWFLPAAIGGGVGVVAIIAATALFLSGAFMTPIQKVATAAGNTFAEAGVLGDVLEATMKAVSNNKSTTRFMMQVQGQGMELEMRNSGKDVQIWGKGDFDGMPELEGTLTLNNKELQAYVPVLGDYVFFYNYKGENDGFIFDEVDDEVAEALNKMLEQIYSRKWDMDSEALKQMIKDLNEWVKDIDIEEVDKDEFEIDGKDVNCAGYEITIDDKMLLEYVEIVCDGYVEYLEELDIDELDEIKDELRDSMYEELADEIEGMEEVTLTVYMHANKLAAVIVEVEDSDEKLEILFEGGDYRAQNITVKFAKKKVLQFKGERDGKEEYAELIAYNGDQKMTVLEYEYDKKDGDFGLYIFGSMYDESPSVIFEGNIVLNNNGVEITDGELSSNGTTVMELEFSCTKGATIEKLEGERFDVGNADEDDWKDIVEDIQDALSGIY